MKLFVTGAAGFIGSNYVRWVLANSDHEITVFDKLTYAGNLDNIRDVLDDRRCRFVRGDICDQEAVLATSVVTTVVHFAAESHVDRLDRRPVRVRDHQHVRHERALRRVTSTGRRALPAHLDRRGVRLDRIGLVRGERPAWPRSPYSPAKAGSDLIALSYHTTYGLPVVTGAPTTTGRTSSPKLIPLFTTNLLDGKRGPLMGDGGNVRDWIHVEDHNRRTSRARAGVVGEIYNIGAHNEITNREITTRLLELTGRDESFIEWVPDRLGHDRRCSVEIDKITALG